MLKASAFLVQPAALLESHCERIWESFVLNLRAGSRKSTEQVKTRVSYTPKVSSLTGDTASCYFVRLPRGPSLRALGIRVQLLVGGGKAEA